jgi:hypothetical protein
MPIFNDESTIYPNHRRLRKIIVEDSSAFSFCGHIFDSERRWLEPTMLEKSPIGKSVKKKLPPGHLGTHLFAGSSVFCHSITFVLTVFALI